MKPLLLLLLTLVAGPAFSQKAQYVKDAQTGCAIWADDFTPADSLSWNGPCKNGYASGTGTLYWYRDHKIAAIYKGGMQQGHFNGPGSFDIVGYVRYTGTFKNGGLEGKGAAYYYNGGKTIGNFVNGAFLNLDKAYLPLLKKQYLPITDSTEIYINDDSNRLFYYALFPTTIKAVLVLLPSTGETAENVISCNKQLIQQAYYRGILPVVLSVNFNKGLEHDTQALHFLDAVFEELVTKYHAPKNKFVLCGLSLGGNNALQYTEMSRNKQYKTYLQPMAVIGVDPPVDMTDLYHHAQEEIANYTQAGDTASESKQAALTEDRFLIASFEKEYGGTPETAPDAYVAGSQFSRNRKDGGNAQFLVDVPVRLYCDPDVLWQLENKNRDYYHMNAANLSAMTNFLMLHGNKDITFIPAVGKGFRVDGTRHPHSWSIVEPVACIWWILNLAK